WLHGSPPTEATAHIHARYMQAGAPQQAGGPGPGLGGPLFGGPWSTGYNAVGYNRFSTGSYGNLNTPGVPSKQPYYGFGSLNYGPFGTGMYGNNRSSGAGNGNSNYRSGNSGYGNRRNGYGGYGGMGGYGGGGFGGGGYGGGYGPYSVYGYSASGALGYGDPHSRYYFGASPYNSPSTYRYGGHSAIPHVPPFQNFAQPSGLAPYSYLYVNPRTPQGPDHPVMVENPFAKRETNGAASGAGQGEESPSR
ncbi:MAG TPA: hypothetical protein VMV10_23210, partial [Pirellulales bacterium]|nr:hypothetical protein [Pirellulales bacterium]